MSVSPPDGAAVPTSGSFAAGGPGRARLDVPLGLGGRLGGLGGRLGLGHLLSRGAAQRGRVADGQAARGGRLRGLRRRDGPLRRARLLHPGSHRPLGRDRVQRQLSQVPVTTDRPCGMAELADTECHIDSKCVTNRSARCPHDFIVLIVSEN